MSNQDAPPSAIHLAEIRNPWILPRQLHGIVSGWLRTSIVVVVVVVAPRAPFYLVDSVILAASLHLQVEAERISK